ncbi:hypothetical protein KPH14_012651 [Odynerus spinipes]|uniref:Uncharacterized protein n=1 Tax=Odynerus spinipes TaxID=1348599 RepID=A0AAD9RG00_9HYME|nr:hypothetical protein KPH14_012651 [Odynerus spinipes]
MRILIDRIQADFSSYSKTGEVQILNAYAKDGRKFSIMYGGFLYTVMVIFMFAPLKPLLVETFNSTNERPLIHHVEYFVDTQNYYYLVILHSHVTIVICIVTIVTLDTIFLVLIQHACGLFATLGYQLHCVAENQPLDMNMNPSIQHDETYKKMSECVYRHKKAIEFADLLESYYSTSFFLQSGLIMMAMSVTGLQAVINMNETSKLLQQLAFSYGQLAYIFFESINGQRLMDHSEQMHEHLINVEWYQTTIRTRKAINLMLLRSQVPCTLTAARLFVISMETFSAIIRTSMSYFTVLHSMQ